MLQHMTLVASLPVYLFVSLACTSSSSFRIALGDEAMGNTTPTCDRWHRKSNGSSHSYGGSFDEIVREKCKKAL
uniref:Putative secreted protein n=1 Tax=Anopheles darlingi TaxID=43151 RepID=A0A2M4DG20_ANODA